MALSGGSAGELLSGGTGNDRLTGANGNDRLTGGRGRNSYSGGRGNAANGVREKKIDCGPGRRDRAVVDRRDKVKNCERVRRRRR